MGFGIGTGATSEGSALSGASWEELDLEALERHIRQRAPGLLVGGEQALEAAAQRLGLAAEVGRRLVPTTAGMLLFGRCPQLGHPQWGVAAVRVAGVSLSDELEARQDLEGDLRSLLEEGMRFVEAHGERLVNQVDPSRSELEFAPRAVREALLNALIHRDLRASGRVALRIFEDRLEIWSPGGVPGSQEEFQALLGRGGVSLPRNPLLAATARQMGLGEGLGRGLPVMRRAVEEQGGQPVELECGKNQVLVTIPSALRAARPRTQALWSN